MKIFSILITLLFTLSFSAYSQTTPGSVIVVAVSGKVKYESPNLKKPITITPGSVVSMDGSFIFGSGDKVLCLYEDKFYQIQGNGSRNIRKSIEAVKTKPVINFDSEFSQYIRAAVEFQAAVMNKDGWAGITGTKTAGDGWAGITPTKTADDGWAGITGTKTAGDGWSGITDTKTAGDGWSSKDGNQTDPANPPIPSIQPQIPIGKLAMEVVIFRWNAAQKTKQYRVEILDQNNQVVHSTVSKKASAEIDLTSLKLKAGETYSWRVATAENDKIEAAPTVKFQVTAKKDADAAMRRSLKSKLGAANNPILKNLMEAVALEQEEFYSAALEKYETALEEDPNNQMVRMNYSAFLTRRKWKEAAQLVMSGKRL